MKYISLLFLTVLLSCSTTKQPAQMNAVTADPVKDSLYMPYAYSAKVVDIYDGDTFTLDFELGFGFRFEDVIRLARVDTPELRGEERPQGIKVRDAVQKLLLDKQVLVHTKKDDRGKYGRLLVEIYFKSSDCQCWVNLNDYLLQNNMADLY